MGKFYQRIILLLSGNSEKKIFEDKTFSTITFAGAITCFVGLISNMFTNSYFLMNLVLGLFGVIFFVFFYLSSFRSFTKPLILPFQILVTSTVILNWFYYQGIEGSTPFYFILTMVGLIYSVSEKKYWFVLVSYFLLAVVLITIHYLYPERVISYTDENSRINDLSFGFIVSLILLAYVIIVLKKNFDLEHLKTEQKNKELEESEARFRDIAMSSSDWIWETDENNIYTFCSEKVEEMLGYTPNEMLGKTPFDFMPQDDVEETKEKIWQVVIEKKPFRNVENWNLTKAGNRICFLTSGVPIIDHLENLIGYRGTVTDITERKQAEVALQESKALLIELNATKDKFFTIIAHDLKSPFNSIIGFSNLLAQKVHEKDYEGIEKYTGIIQKTSQHTMDLVMNLLEWSRSQTGRMPYHPETFEIVALINEVAELLNNTALQKSITIYAELPHSALVFADRAMIGTVLRNLISNAIKFTHPKGEIVVSAEQKQDELCITISDNGIGIKKEIIDKLFRIDENNSTLGTQNEVGTGLGLILCKEFVTKHGGKIWVESEVEKGSKFHFTVTKN